MNCHHARIGVLTGPSHAEEVAIAIPTVLVIASHDEEILELNTRYIYV